jgi:hypothetical protein
MGPAETIKRGAKLYVKRKMSIWSYSPKSLVQTFCLHQLVLEHSRLSILLRNHVFGKVLKMASTSCGQSDGLHGGACVALHGVEQMWVEIFSFF